MDLKNYLGPFFLWMEWESLWHQAKPTPLVVGSLRALPKLSDLGKRSSLLTQDSCFWQDMQMLVHILQNQQEEPTTASKIKPYNLCKNQLKIDYRIKCKIYSYKLSGEKIAEDLQGLELGEKFLD